jgi:molybdopterin/thiamine biosynthesis adenylyltransferase
MPAEADLSRYAAHLALEPIGPEGQQRIRSAKVALVGMGGLGCPAAWYLAGSGVGELHLFDFDTVSRSNLARQLLYGPADVGRRKCKAAAEALDRLNPGVALFSHDTRVDDGFLSASATRFDLVLDASDNYGTRLAVNRACLASNTPWVMGSCIRMEGQAMFFDPGSDSSPCYRCAYGNAPESLEDCPGAGIFAPVAGMTGATMAHLALLRLAGAEPPPGLHLLDAGRMAWSTLKVNRDLRCPDCGANGGKG